MAAVIEEYTYKTIRLAKWNFETPVAHVGRTQYFPVRHFCKWLDIDSGTQIGVIKGDSRFDGALHDIPFKTPVGWRPSVWVRRDKLALWLLHIEPKRCKLGSREKLEEFQEEVLQEAQKLLFGNIPQVPSDERGLVSASSAVRVEVTMNCLDCGAPHYIVHENGVTTVERVREGLE